MGEGFVVEHAAVDEGTLMRVEAGAQVIAEVLHEKAFPPMPGQAAFLKELLHLAKAGRRVGSGKTRRGAGRESKAGHLFVLEIAFRLAAPPAYEGKFEDMTMLALGDHRRIVEREMTHEAEEIGHRDEGLEPVAGGHQRAVRRGRPL